MPPLLQNPSYAPVISYKLHPIAKVNFEYLCTVVMWKWYYIFCQSTAASESCSCAFFGFDIYITLHTLSCFFIINSMDAILGHVYEHSKFTDNL